MKISKLIKEDMVILDLNSDNKLDIIEELIDKLDKADCLNDRERFKREIFKREFQGSTGIGDGIAVPHAKTDAVKFPAIVFGRSKAGLDFDSLDGEKTKLFFMIAANEVGDREHLETISKLARFLMDKNFSEKLLDANSIERVLDIIDGKEKEVDNKIIKNTDSEEFKKKLILAVTSCPTGIAHTYMAADALNQKAEEMEVDIKVETNGSIGVKNLLTAEDIKKASLIIVAADTKVLMDRFHGKKVIETSVSEAIRNPAILINKAIEGDGKIYKAKKENLLNKEIDGKNLYINLMNGVSNMLPFITAGGIFIALAFLFDFSNAGLANYGSGNKIALFLNTLGETTFSFMLPILAGYIAFSIGDRPALAPGFIGGVLAAKGNAGFLGALFAGFLAGYIIVALKKLLYKIPDSLEGLKPVLLYPVFGVLIVGIIMNFLIIPPLEWINSFMNSFLNTLAGSDKVVLGLILGGMMAVDMGGPVNKATYLFGIASLAEGNGHIMAAVMAGGMVPPLGIAIATTLFKEKFTSSERNAGKTNYIMGLSFITEGAIPFAAADPKTVIPAVMIGASIAGGLSELFKVSSPAPHGGIFILPLVSNWHLYILSILIGSIITAFLLKIFKKDII